MIPFNYHHLFYFYTIAQEGSISKATQVLRLAQPTLSAQLRQFENFLNTRLFERENRRLILTEEGRKVFSYAKLIFDIGQELKDRMVDLSGGGAARIQIGITNHVPKTIIEKMLGLILDASPSTYLEVKKDRIENLIQNLDDHIIDLVLTDSPFAGHVPENIVKKFVGKVPIVFCSNAALAKKIRRFPQDLTGKPLLLPAAPRAIFYTLKEFLYENRIEPKIVGEIEDIETVRRLALRGYGIAALNQITVLEAPAKKKLTIINKKPTQLFENVYFLVKKRKQSHPLTELVLNNFKL